MWLFSHWNSRDEDLLWKPSGTQIQKYCVENISDSWHIVFSKLRVFFKWKSKSTLEKFNVNYQRFAQVDNKVASVNHKLSKWMNNPKFIRMIMINSLMVIVTIMSVFNRIYTLGLGKWFKGLVHMPHIWKPGSILVLVSPGSNPRAMC